MKEKTLKEAVALKYDRDKDAAPRVVATGSGFVAEKIVEKAQENNVPVYENTQLAHSLAQLNLGEEIPPELYEVMAEILVFIGNLDQAYGEGNENK